MPTGSTLERGEQVRLHKAVAKRVYSIGSTLPSSQLFGSLFRDIKSQFGVDSYKNLKRKDLQAAIRFAESWKLE
ncbi:ORF6C domain-containing protein [Sporosarcina sp. FSL K6-5500]|uniref:ORF6C domain-containing protein n=1 Tax=Sporosarcina sp. FSL K6-5500 TaxID=2921558 RepID=UPI004046E657